MKRYQYQILRYIHDRVTGEFVNVGLVMYSQNDAFLRGKVLTRYGRITSFFAGVNGKQVIRSCRNFAEKIRRESGLLVTSGAPEFLKEITERVIVPDDSALVLTDVRVGLDVDLDRSFDSLYRIYVDRWNSVIDDDNEKDSDVWKVKYKHYFDQFGITERLRSYEISTPHDTFVFDKAWKNEIWHCYQPLSFNLKNVENLKNKIYKWSGKINELKSTDEPIELTILASFPGRNEELRGFMEDSLKTQTDGFNVEIVYESDAESFAQGVAAMIEFHDQQEGN